MRIQLSHGLCDSWSTSVLLMCHFSLCDNETATISSQNFAKKIDNLAKRIAL
jgi:hypothetical protein